MSPRIAAAVLLLCGCGRMGLRPVDCVEDGPDCATGAKDGGSADAGPTSPAPADAGNADAGPVGAGPYCDFFDASTIVERSAGVDPSRTTGDCSAADGPVRPWTSAQELKMLLTGRWEQCAGAKLAWLEQSDGIEVTPEGFFFLLFRDPSGNLVRGPDQRMLCVVNSVGGTPYGQIPWSSNSTLFLHPTFGAFPSRMSPFQDTALRYVAIP